MSGIGEVELAIATVDGCVKIAFFIKDWIQKAEHFGEHVRIIQKQVATESARLQSFYIFLNTKMTNNKTRFQLLPEIHQSVIVGMIQELEIIFFGYSTAIAKYNIEELQRGYELEAGPTADIHLNRDVLLVQGIESAQKTQARAKKIDKATWGLFKQKKIARIISNLESWNNKLMNFLLCGIYFLKEPEEWCFKEGEGQEDQHTM